MICWQPHRPPSVSALMAALMTVLLLGGCGPGSTMPAANPSGPPVPSVPGAVPRPDHIVVVVFENKAYQQVIGAAAAPYLTSLAHTGANFTDAHGERHPSQPNYVALLAGSTHGVTDDSCPQQLGTQPNLARQLLDSGRSFAGYSADLPGVGFTGCSSPDGRYARKHNPWVDFTNIPASANLPLSALPTDLAALPTFAIVIPNMCDDMHDCPVANGDAWAQHHLPAYLDWAHTHNSLLIVTFDEDNGTAANHIPTLFAGPMVRPGDVPTHIDHYTILRTIEDMYQLAPLGAAAATPPITGIWAP
ncbi:MAG: acid phosphatase [Pseudonocardiales bacterium]|nr:acid phosphatase [Pseudonocardiales bacterium]